MTIDEMIKQAEAFNDACRQVVWALMAHRYARDDGTYNWEGIQRKSGEIEHLLEQAWAKRPALYGETDLHERLNLAKEEGRQEALTQAKAALEALGG